MRAFVISFIPTVLYFTALSVALLILFICLVYLIRSRSGRMRWRKLLYFRSPILNFIGLPVVLVFLILLKAVRIVVDCIRLVIFWLKN